MKKVFLIIFLNITIFQSFNTAFAQVGDYRNVFAVGANAGYAMNTINFIPDVPQSMHGGYTFGITGRYTSEKYFSTICSIQAEMNITQLGWKEDIATLDGTAVINPLTETEETYSRNITYLQIPVLAHLAWGKERHGVNAFICAGPQIGFLLSDNIDKSYDVPFTQANFPDTYDLTTGRVNSEVAQETMDIENKVDYGIVAGGGIEWDIKKIGRFALEARYYYGLGNLYGDSKKDEFSKSANGTITIKLSYLRDL